MRSTTVRARAGTTRAAFLGAAFLAAVEKTRRQRETDTLDALFYGFPALEGWICGLGQVIRDKPLLAPKVEGACQHIVNCDEAIRTLAPSDVSPQLDGNWVTWHVARSTLVLFCDYVRQGTTNTADMTCKTRKRWVNRKHDLDYLICLQWADAIASQETAGEMAIYRNWLYGDAKPMVCMDTLE